ncbi:TonB family protein [Horticoccus luteus]|uniref:TonB family protein n=1 Tax=Horticoccus luteus TaxID=2862869 RepID=A0A8F9XKT3_9BACT|nr:energy transducer TonB [Horticoccus luteus]QYM78521.1 TonB family protein [Horticoccus luteus]
MRRDLIIGVILSLAIHGGVAWLPQLFKGGTKAPPPKEEVTTIELMKMPPLEPEEPEEIPNDEPQTPIEFAPPMQADVPQIVPVDAFVQQIQPPPPEGLKPNTGVITIPQGRPGGFGKGIEIFDVSKLDKSPVPKVRVAPNYPFEMKRSGITGEVVVDFIVDTHGDVQNAFAVRSTQREFEQPAVQAVSKWKFTPGRKNGRAVYSHLQVPIEFKLDD